jgi:hypothetical protein
MYENGAKACYNRPEDVQKVVQLLNSIPAVAGGAKEHPVDGRNPSPRQMFDAILRFQRNTNAVKRDNTKKYLATKNRVILEDLKRVPSLWEDGHVDPHEQTLRWLNKLSQAQADLQALESSSVTP